MRMAKIVGLLLVVSGMFCVNGWCAKNEVEPKITYISDVAGLEAINENLGWPLRINK